MAKARQVEDTLMGVAELAEYLDVEKGRVQRLLQRGRLPEPHARLATGPVWFKSAVDASGVAEYVEQNRRSRGD